MKRNCVRDWRASASTVAVVAAVAFGAGSAVAQEAAPATPTASAPGQVEEVVVTAQRRSENLQTVPISAQVVTGSTLAQQNLTTLTNIAQTMPSVHIDAAGRSNEIYIRGIGSGQNQSFDQSVGLFIDDVYHGRSRITSGTLLDVSRVEVLKGPQSTFFGNNAIAGALNVVTEKPTRDFEGWARALASPTSGTNGGQYAVEGAVSGPLTDKLSARLAATFNGQNGWLENVNLDQKVPRLENLAGRLTFLYQGDDGFDATLKVEGSRNRNDGTRAEQMFSCPPPAPFVAAGFCASAVAQGLPTGLDKNESAYSDGQGVKLDTWEGVLTLNKQLGADTFTSVTAYYGYDFDLKLDTDQVPQTGLNAHVPEKFHQFSQEFRLASPLGGKIEYLAGLYFQTDNLRFNQELNYAFVSPKVTGTPALAALVPYLPIGTSTNFDQDEQVYSAFGSLSLNATDRLKLSAGLRASSVKKSFNWNLFYGQSTNDYGNIVPLPDNLVPLAQLLGLGTQGALEGDRTDNALMPSARIQFQATPTLMTYASYSRGFKAGGFNGTDNSANIANLPYGPEHVNAYEAGFKGEWFDRRVLFNASVFLSDYDDLQVSVSTIQPSGALFSVVRNAAQARSQGVEMEGQWLLTDRFRLSANATYLDSHYVDYQNVSPTALQTLNGLKVQDLSGKATPFAPKWSGNLTANYRMPLSSSLDLVGELNTYFSSSYYFSATDDDLIGKQGGFARLDARLSLEAPDGHWAFDIIGKNLTDRTIVVFGSVVPTSLGSASAVKEQPRNFAVQARYRW